MHDIFKGFIAILLGLCIYRITLFGFTGSIPYDIHNWINFLLDFLSISISFLTVRLLLSKSTDKKFAWWITLVISILPALVLIVLFRALAMLFFY